MRSLPSDVLLELAKLQGSEPLTIVGVQWNEAYVLYSDKALPGIHGKINNISSIDHALSSSTINSSTVSIVLDDTSGLARGFYANKDLHKRRCFVYQYYADINKKFIIFSGLTNSPITWDEGDRAVSFSVLSEIEDKEVGFSPEEADYDYVSQDSVGEAWPLCFGDVVHVPAVKTRSTPTGILKTKLCIVDTTLYYKLSAIVNAYCSQIFVYNYYKQIASRAETVTLTMYQHAQQWITNLQQRLGNIPTTPVEKTTVAYCLVIGMEDAVRHDVENLVATLNQQKEDFEKRKKGQLAWGGLTPKKYREQIKETRDNIKEAKQQLKDLVKGKKIIEDHIEQLDFELDLQRTAFIKQTEAYNTIVALYHQYLEVLNEYCAQKKCETNFAIVDGGEDFPQGTAMDLLIKDMRVRGVFTGDRFDIAAYLPKYRSVPLGLRQSIISECGQVDAESGLNKFWVPSNDYVLKNCWALVLKTDGTKHIINITEQDGTECTFELTSPEDDHSGHSGGRRGADYRRADYELYATSHPFPLFRGPNVPNASFVPIYNTPFGQIPPLDAEAGNIWNSRFIRYVNDALTRYGADILDADETERLQMLQRMYEADVAEDYIFFQEINPRDIYKVLGLDIAKIIEVAPVPLATWFRNDIDVFEMPDQALWDAEPGTEVTDMNNPYEIYVANILPSDVKAVMAHRVNEKGETYLDVVPPEYYDLNEAEELADDFTVTSLRFKTPLKSIQGEQWDDNVYISLSSSVGPNVVDILIHLIGKYTTKTYDATSFDHVRDLFEDKYPANFALFDRRNILTVLQEIAFQARCQLVLVDEIFYLYYLAEEPESVRTLTDSDVEYKTLSLTYGDTENLVTKLTAEWRPDYLPETKAKKIVLRQNIEKYGLHEQTYSFYIYNIRSLVLKSATFWLIRWSNTWKQVSFNTFLTNLDLQLNDAVTLDISQAPAGKALIDGIKHDVNSKTIVLSFWLPMRANDTVQYPFAWPADTELEFPLPENNRTGIKLKHVTGDPDVE